MHSRHTWVNAASSKSEDNSTLHAVILWCMMTSSNENIFRVTDHLCGEFPVNFPTQRPVTRSCVVFFDLHLNKRLSKQRWGWWFETVSRPLWRHRYELSCFITSEYNKSQISATFIMLVEISSHDLMIFMMKSVRPRPFNRFNIRFICNTRKSVILI